MSVKRNYKPLRIEPHIPESLLQLKELSRNFHFSWAPQIIELFESIDIELWERCHNNPYKMLIELSRTALKELSNKSFLSRLDSVHNTFKNYLGEGFSQSENDYPDEQCIAYFCTEFGLHECFPNYSGGLGILAGDHIKTASDINMPLVAVGILYRYGYFSQYLSSEGWQQEKYPLLDTFSIPMELLCDEKKKPLLIEVEFPERVVYLQAWKIDVGKVPLYLLDSSNEKNSFEDRKITDRLYTSDKETRIQQELILGVGGVKLLQAIGKNPTILHMNEGHSAFSSLERIRHYITRHNLNYTQAKELVKASTLFTTHTPVPAGNEEFPDEMIRKYLKPFIDTFKMDFQEFLNLGRIHKNEKEMFGLTPFSIRSSAYCNGVSKLHGEVSRYLWRDIWEELYVNEIPIDSITNGIHIPTWISDEISRLFARYLDPDWLNKTGKESTWSRVDSIPDNELWKAQERLKDRLIGFIRKRVRRSLVELHAPAEMIDDSENLLNADALTIGFARRFATYKRASLLFKDKERFKKIISNKKRPVQFIFTGKAHPADREGKKLIEEIIHIAREEGFKNKLVFLENYDMEIARYLVQGVDVWLNTPRRPYEASGTSGMKAAINGGLNISVADGWWDEAYQADIGWTIGKGEEYDEWEYQDFIESQALYEILEEALIPAYYNRGVDNLPKEWIKKSKRSIKHCAHHFNSERMVEQYGKLYYNPATEKYKELAHDNFIKLKEYESWFSRVQKYWHEVKVEEYGCQNSADIHSAGEEIDFISKIQLGKLQPKDVKVTLFYGKENREGKIIFNKYIHQKHTKDEKGLSLFHTKLVPEKGGKFFYTIRVIPCHPMLSRSLEPGMITWA